MVRAGSARKSVYVNSAGEDEPGEAPAGAEGLFGTSLSSG